MERSVASLASVQLSVVRRNTATDYIPYAPLELLIPPITFRVGYRTPENSEPLMGVGSRKGGRRK